MGEDAQAPQTGQSPDETQTPPVTTPGEGTPVVPTTPSPDVQTDDRPSEPATPSTETPAATPDEDEAA